MLYDKRWDRTEVKPADIFSLESLIAWLEKQPAAESYRYTCNGHCLLARYFTDMGFHAVNVDPFSVVHRDGRDTISQDFNDIAIDRYSRWGFGGISGHTFGAALARARTAMSEGQREIQP